MSSSIPVITIRGDAHTVGMAHAKATMHLRDDVASFVKSVRQAFPSQTVSQELDSITEVLAQHSPDTLDQISGMAQVFELHENDMLLSVLQTYFDSLGKSEPGADQGCSVYAYASDQATVLVKNRDTGKRFLNRQTILQVSDEKHYAWSALSTAGAPGVHSAGMNEHGLSIADTHVPSRKIGPGLPRFSMMMNMLQQCRTVEEALHYYRTTPSMGFGNLVLQDTAGAMAVIECGYDNSGIVETTGAFLTATNHFVTEAMSDAGLRAADGTAGLDSRKRKSLLDVQLKQLGDRVIDDPMAPMQHHEEAPIGSVCVHEEESPTISTVVMDPKHAVFGVAHGNPCRSELIEYSALPQNWRS